MPRRLKLAFLAALSIAALVPVAAHAQIARIEGPRLHPKAQAAARTRSIRQARSQRVKPQKIEELSRQLTAQARLRGQGGAAATVSQRLLADQSFRKAISVAPMRARLEVFKAMVTDTGNTSPTFERRLRGMLKNGKQVRVSSPKKTFFEVTPETLGLFHSVMGPNTVWFLGAEGPGHLHTIVADQNGGPNLTHNTYGSGSLDAATITRTQYAAPVQLTDAEMDRFVRYLNAGIEHGKAGTYGFRTSSGDLVCQTACTNWATSAPVGRRLRWVRTLDQRVARAVAEGKLGPELAEGLHAALAKAPTAQARAELVAKVAKSSGVSKWTRSSAKRLGKVFEDTLTNFPNRPADLVARESLSQTMGVARSQDPAKWLYDLFMSKKVPVLGVFNQQSAAEAFKDMAFNMEIMGHIDATGNVVQGDQVYGLSGSSLGIVPAERRPAAQPAPAGQEAAAP